MNQAKYFDAEGAIIQQLKTELQGGSPPATAVKLVAAAATLAGSSVALQAKIPCVFVAPGETSVNDDGSEDGDLPEEQTWEIVVCVAHTPDAKNFEVTTAALDGGLLLKVKAALAGFEAAAGARLIYAGRPAPSFQDDRFPGIARFFINFKLPAMPAT